MEACCKAVGKDKLHLDEASRVLIRELIAIMAEGKVSEPFGPTVREWLHDASKVKKTRLAFLKSTLGVSAPSPLTIRYQLPHRTTSSMIEAKRFNAPNAMMLVHSFSQNNEWLDDYAGFASSLGVKATVGRVHLAKEVDGTNLYLSWVACDRGTLLSEIDLNCRIIRQLGDRR